MNLVLLSLFLGIALFFGGASRADVLSQAVVRVAAIVLIAITALQMGREEWSRVQIPVLFLMGIALLIGVQLVPLPPDLWSSLPGRRLYADGLELAGILPVWRPWSLTPDLTLNSLLAVLPPLAVILALGLIDPPYKYLLVPLLITGAVASAVIGLVQFSSGSLYFYRVTNLGSLVGVFANRNHHALFLAAILPILACWVALPHNDAGYRRLRTWMALCASAAIFPLLLITGSRAGLVLGLLGASAAAFLAFRDRRRSMGAATRTPISIRLLALLPIVAGALAVVAANLLARDEAVRRFFEGNAENLRAEMLPLYQHIARDFFPIGSGYGSFDPVFRSYEPDAMLDATYLNHAHNDLAQIIIEGGVLPLLLLVPFLGWYIIRSWRVWSTPIRSTDQLLGRSGSALILLILLSSLVDYPLRTPFIAVLLALSCYWLLDQPKAGGTES
jgi:O-antigen ligase